MVSLKRILKKYLLKDNVRKVYNIYYNQQIDIFNIDIDILNPPIEMEIYYFIKEIYQLSRIGVYKFTACYKCFSIKNLRLTSNEHMHYLVPLQMKLYFNYEKIYNLQKSRWMDINNIFSDEKAFVNKEKKREFKELCKNHYYYCSKIFCFFFRKIEENIWKLTIDDFIKILNFFTEESRDFEKKILVYSLISSKHPKKELMLHSCLTVN